MVVTKKTTDSIFYETIRQDEMDNPWMVMVHGFQWTIIIFQNRSNTFKIAAIICC